MSSPSSAWRSLWLGQLNLAPVRPSFELERIERRLLLASVTGSFFNDLNGNGQLDAGEPGIPGFNVYMDANRNGVWDGASHTRPSVDTPKPLPDIRDPQFSFLPVSGVGTFTHVRVAIDITHTFNADLDVFLISPSGTRVELFTDVGGSGDGMNIILDQDAFANINTAPAGIITGTWRPEGNLSVLYGTNANGTWTLELTDDAAGDSGTLNSWSLTFGTGERMTTSHADGRYRFDHIAAGTYDVRQVNQEGWIQTAPANGFHTVQLAGTTNATGRNFGNRQPPGTIRGVVWDDLNANGERESGEPGLEGWTVYLDLNNNAVRDPGEPFRLSAADGSYEFSNLAPGNYIVREVLKPGYVQTAPNGVREVGGEDPTGPAVLDSNRDFTKTEVIVAFQGAGGLQQLRGSLARDPLLASWVDMGTSTHMGDVRDTSLVEVKLRPNVDPLKVVNAFWRIGEVEWAEPNYLFDEIDPRDLIPNDPQYSQQYHHPLMKNNLAWDITLGSPDIIVAVTDDGFLLNHPDLVGSWVPGWDFWSNDPDPTPGSASNDHGTHVAGIVGARTNNGIGVAGTAGNVKLMPIRFYGGSGWTATHVFNAYKFAADNGANIMVTSYNVDGFVNNSTFHAAINYMYDGGVLHFNSAGNNNALNPPRARFDHSLYVASTTQNDSRSSFTNYGWGIDIAAPGTSILSTSIGSNLNDPNYEVKSGTSMAAPNAAAVAALIWSANPTWTREQVAAQLLATADNIDAANPSFIGLLGAGRVNSYRGVTESIAPPRIKSLVGLPAEGGDVLTAPTSFTIDVASIFDPSTMNLSSFELRSAGIDGIFGNGDDVLIPLTLAFGGDNASTYRIGTNRLFFNVAGNMGSGTYRFSVLPTATDPFGQPIDGNGDGIGGDAFTRTFTLTGPTIPNSVTLNPGQVLDGVDFGNHDILPPSIVSSGFLFETFHGLSFRFSESVIMAQGSALTLLNLTTGQSVNTAGFTLTWDSATNTATYRANGILADGNYRATLLSSGVADPSGNNLAGGNHHLNFFFLNGDATRDRHVDANDLAILRANFGQSGKTFSQGDFNYDGVVNALDLAIIRGRFGGYLPPTDGLFGDGGGDDDGEDGPLH